MWAGFFYAKLRRRLHYDEWHLKGLDYLRIRIGGGEALRNSIKTIAVKSLYLDRLEKRQFWRLMKLNMTK